MKEKFAKFMQGRYGIDNFSRFLLAVAVACMLCSALLHAPALNSICWILLFCLYFRMFFQKISKKTLRRRTDVYGSEGQTAPFLQRG